MTRIQTTPTIAPAPVVSSPAAFAALAVLFAIVPGMPTRASAAPGDTCDSVASCQALTPPSCVGIDACANLGTLFFGRIGAGPCNGDYACQILSGTIGDDACNGLSACQFVSGTVADDSCNGNPPGVLGFTGGGACQGNSGTIDTGSCNGDAVCYMIGGPIGAGSCNGFNTCLMNASGIGDGSCNGESACYGRGGSVGNYSCNGGSYPCDGGVEPIGDCTDNSIPVPACDSADTTPPVITVPADLAAAATSTEGAPVSYTATAADDIDGPTPVDCTPAAGSTFPLGLTMVTCAATDGAGNTASADFTVDVTYAWLGFEQPLDPDGSTIFRLGRTIPLKFRLTGDSAAITDAVATLFAAKVSDSVIGTYFEDTGNAGSDSGNTFRYDPTSQQYVFNLSTSGDDWTPGTYVLRVDLNDGVGTRTVQISLQ